MKKDGDGNIVPANTALELQDYFEEIMIDEYQDSNEVQELLLKCISGEDILSLPIRFRIRCAHIQCRPVIVLDISNFRCHQLAAYEVRRVRHLPAAPEIHAESLLAQSAAENDDTPKYSEKETEAVMVAERIRQIVGKFPVTDSFFHFCPAPASRENPSQNI